MWKANQSQRSIVTRSQLTSSPMFSFAQYAYAPCPEKYFTHLYRASYGCNTLLLFSLSWTRVIKRRNGTRNVNDPFKVVKMKMASKKWQRRGRKQRAHLIGPLKLQSKASWDLAFSESQSQNTIYSTLSSPNLLYNNNMYTKNNSFIYNWVLFIKKKNITDTNATHSRMKSVFFFLSKYSFRCVGRIVQFNHTRVDQTMYMTHWLPCQTVREVNRNNVYSFTR